MAETFLVPFCHEQPRLVYQDDYLLVVEKPAGLLSVPGRDERNRDCLISRLQQSHPSARIVHRLDFSTSGLMVVALDDDVHKVLSVDFAERKITKCYQALVAGLLVNDDGVVDLPLICDWPNRPKQKVDSLHGKPALTRYKVEQRYPEIDCTELLLKPVTGRSHQLRVHMAELGHAILGCEFYADETVKHRASRLLLHACELGFEHSISGEALSFSSRINLREFVIT